MDRVDHFGRDLFVVLDREDRRPLRVQLEEQLRDGVRSGRLHAGTALPSTRALAVELGVARGVVVEAYGQLVAEGFLVARRGSATRVAKVAPAGRRRRPRPARACRRSASTCARSRPTAAPSRAARGWRRCAARWRPRPTPTSATARGPARRGCAPSSPPTSAARAAWSPSPTTSSSPPGITQAIALLAGLLRARGARRVLVEEPGFWQHRTILQRAGLELVPVDVDDGGLRTDALPPPRRPRWSRPRTSSRPAPSSRPSAARRCSTWAAAHDALVIEDDYDGEYRYDREPVGALQGLGAGRVAYLGSTSKTLAPALRLGWMVLPGALAGAIADERGWADGGSPALDQLALASFIERGELDRHLRRMRLRYRRRRDRLVAALGSTCPTRGRRRGGRAARHRGAGARRRRRRGAGARAARGVAVFATHHAGRPLLLVGYANIAEEAIEPAVRALAAAVRASLARVPEHPRRDRRIRARRRRAAHGSAARRDEHARLTVVTPCRRPGLRQLRRRRRRAERRGPAHGRGRRAHPQAGRRAARRPLGHEHRGRRPPATSSSSACAKAATTCS